MEKIKSRIISCDLQEFKNQKTGEVTQMTKIVYTYPRTNSETEIGSNVLICYRPGNLISKIKPYIDTKDLIDVEIDEKLDMKTSTFKKVLKKINFIEL